MFSVAHMFVSCRLVAHGDRGVLAFGVTLALSTGATQRLGVKYATTWWLSALIVVGIIHLADHTAVQLTVHGCVITDVQCNTNDRITAITVPQRVRNCVSCTESATNDRLASLFWADDELCGIDDYDTNVFYKHLINCAHLNLDPFSAVASLVHVLLAK